MTYKTSEHYSEEILFDYINDTLSEMKKREVKQHLIECTKCQMTIDSWQQLLQLENNEEQLITPSPQLKNRLMESIHLVDEQKVEKHVKKGGNKKLIFRIGALAAAAFLVVNLFQYHSSERDSSVEVLHNDEIHQMTIVTSPNSNEHAIIPLINEEELEGNVWLDPVKNEMLLELNGLRELNERVYQVWFIHSNDVMDGEILEIVNGRSRMFYRGMDVDKLKLIKGSVEPLGGSVRPTGPETFIIELKR